MNVRWAATKQGTETFISLVMALHYGIVDTCPACDELARVVPLEGIASYVGYECKCGATWKKKARFQYVVGEGTA